MLAWPYWSILFQDPMELPSGGYNCLTVSACWGTDGFTWIGLALDELDCVHGAVLLGQLPGHQICLDHEPYLPHPESHQTV